MTVAGQTAPAAGAPGVPAAGRGLRPPRWVAAFFLLPALLLLGFLVVYPIIYSVGRSLFDTTGTRLVGADNYVRMFTNPSTLIALRNTAIWVAVAPSLVTLLGLFLAVLTERIRWAAALKLILFMPMAISFLAAGVIFRLVYEQQPERGVANAVVTSVRDLFTEEAKYPGARPRSGTQAPLQETGQHVVTRQAYRAGEVVPMPLVGIKDEDLPADAAPARLPAPRPGVLSGTVWLDFSRGGVGTANAVDPTEGGMPAMLVEAVRDGTVVASTKTKEDGSFAFSDLPDGKYTLRLPASNFSAPFRGLAWLGPTLITPAIIGSYLWIWAGFAMVLIAAGLATIPRDVLEAARVDGASEWQVFRKVTAPLLAPLLVVVFVTLVINVLKIFDLVFIIAPGPVQDEATVVALEMWRASFGGGNDQGLGSALAVFLFLLVLPAMIFNIRRFRRELR